MKKLSIIIPVYNEEKFVTQLLDKVLAVHLLNKLEKEITKIVREIAIKNAKS